MYQIHPIKFEKNINSYDLINPNLMRERQKDFNYKLKEKQDDAHEKKMKLWLGLG